MRRLLVIVIVIGFGCSGDVVDPQNDEPEPYTVSGLVVDSEGDGVPAVVIDFESFGTATTGIDGAWSKSGLEGLVTITPTKDGWAFSPGSLDVEEEASDVTFAATALQTMLEVVVEWERIGETTAASSLPGGSFPTAADEAAVEPTHFGTRLEYPEAEAFFAQSLGRVAAEELGLITLEVPPAENTTLLVAAVHLNEEGDGQLGQRDPIVLLGQVRDLEIVEGTATTVGMDDVEWVEPLWTFESDEVRDAYESGVMAGDKDSTNLEFLISVRDPFGDRPWNEFIGLNGIGGASEDAEDGWWQVRVQCRNEFVGEEHDSTCRFWPYLHSERFNLPDVRFSVPPVTAQFTVEWR